MLSSITSHVTCLQNCFPFFISYLTIDVEAEGSSKTKRKRRKGKNFAKMKEVGTVLYLLNQKTIWLSCEVESFN